VKSGLKMLHSQAALLPLTWYRTCRSWSGWISL